MRPIVHLIDQREYDSEPIRTKVRSMLERSSFPVDGKSVFLKPSFVYPARPPRNRGVNTQPEFIGGVVRGIVNLWSSALILAPDMPVTSLFHA